MMKSHLRALLALVTFTLAACMGGGSEHKNLQNGQDLLASGRTTMVSDSVPGDVIIAGSDIGFTGSAGGDYLGMGGNQQVRGQIHGSIRAVGGNLEVAGSIDRNATMAGGNVQLDSSATIGGNAYFAGGNVVVAGNIRGSLMVAGGSVTINGPIARDVVVSGGQLRLGPRAQIGGNLRYRVAKDKVRIDRAAHVAGTTTALPVARKSVLRGVLWTLGVLLMGIIVVSLFPGFTSEAADIVPDRPVRAGLTGLAWGFLVPCAVIIAAITFIGIPLAILGAALYIVLIFLSAIPFAIWLGRLVLGARARTGLEGALLNFVLGGILLVVVGWIPVVGQIVTAIAAILGLGAIILRAMMLRRSEPAHAI